MPLPALLQGGATLLALVNALYQHLILTPSVFCVLQLQERVCHHRQPSHPLWPLALCL